MAKKERQKRRTLDDILGINKIGINFLICIGIIASLLGAGLIRDLSVVIAGTGAYRLFANRKSIDRKSKFIGWSLFILWLVLFSVFGKNA